MSEQLRLLDVPASPPRLRPATIALGKHCVAECRKVLDVASTLAYDGPTNQPKGTT